LSTTFVSLQGWPYGIQDFDFDNIPPTQLENADFEEDDNLEENADSEEDTDPDEQSLPVKRVRLTLPEIIESDEDAPPAPFYASREEKAIEALKSLGPTWSGVYNKWPKIFAL